MNLPEHLEAIIEGLQQGRFLSEAAVSTGVVLRILQSLGWDIFDSSVVCPEYPLSGTRVDFALCYPPSKPLGFIEVKGVGRAEGGDLQLFEYAFHKGVPLTVLTDGQVWSFYLPAEQGDYNERRVYKLDLLERDLEESAYRLKRYLDFGAVREGKAIDAARADYKAVAKKRETAKHLPQAWVKLIEDRDEMLESLISEKVESLSGYKPEETDIWEFLRNLGKSAAFVQDKESSLEPLNVSIKQAPEKHSKSSGYTRAGYGFFLNGDWLQARNAADLMTMFFNELGSLRGDMFLEKASEATRGRSRNLLARNRQDLYLGRPDLCEKCARQLSSGWWIGTNYGRREMEGFLRKAAQVAGLDFERDLQMRI